MKAHHPTQHLDCSLEQNNGGCAVHVVVTIEQHRLTARNRRFQAVNGRGHPQHQKWIVKGRLLGIEKGKCFAGPYGPTTLTGLTRLRRRACGRRRSQCPGSSRYLPAAFGIAHTIQWWFHAETPAPGRQIQAEYNPGCRRTCAAIALPPVRWLLRRGSSSPRPHR